MGIDYGLVLSCDAIYITFNRFTIHVRNVIFTLYVAICFYWALY